MERDNNDLTAGPRYAEVALAVPLRRTFTYTIPAAVRPLIQPGARVIVPFGTRELTGYVVSLADEREPSDDLAEDAIKEIGELVDEEPLINEEMIRLTRWTADYYACSWGEVLRASLPAGINSAVERTLAITDAGRHFLLQTVNSRPVKIQILRQVKDDEAIELRALEKEFGSAKAKRAVAELSRLGYIESTSRPVSPPVKPKLQKAVRLCSDSGDGSDARTSAGQQRVLDALWADGGESLFTDLLERCDVSASVINTLAKRGAVEVFIKEIRRDPLASSVMPAAPDLMLSPEQTFVLGRIEEGLTSRAFTSFLLHGVTGSGKTEVYIRAMRKAADQGRSALMLVPEISLTPVFSRRLRSVFGDQVAILHSNLGAGERFDEWRRIKNGEAKIVIGTRSAVFAPLKDIGLIIVDEEHDASYRQHESPFYHARDVAVVRAKFADAVVVLGSATPSMETFHNAEQGKYHYLQLHSRIGNRPLATAELIDMRDVFRARGKDIAISPQLADAVRETHARGEQSIILLNRRGFSRFVLCRSCGESLRCRNCDITLTYHKYDGRITCHYCGYSVKTPKICPFCQSEFLYFIGEGTEQLEEMLIRIFPELKIERVDRDTMARKGKLAKTLLAFDRGEIDMLVGTQMIAKGHDFHGVTLVGVISVDTGLGLPDFRAAERTFQLLTQVAGRAGRGDLPGRVLIQTYHPEHYVLRHACEQDYEAFYRAELKYRERMSYPPAAVLASFLIKHKDRDTALKNANELKAALDEAAVGRPCRILGVSPASIARLKGEYRFQVLVKSSSRKVLKDVVEIGSSIAEENGCDMRTIFTEIDPVNMM